MTGRIKTREMLVTLFAGIVLVGLAISSAAAAPRPSAASVRKGEFALDAKLSVGRTGVFCSSVGAPPEADSCTRRTGSGVVRGLGKVYTDYLWFVDTTAPGCQGDVLLAAKGKLMVEGKGEIDVALSGLPDCFPILEDMLHATQPFSITGGSGKYAGASGSGTIKHDLAEDVGGYDSWSGRLVVPGLDFDLTPPTLRGAVAKSVRVPRGKTRIRVTYRVTAADGIDGVVRVTCLPRSGSLFRIGRTTVTCSAMDTSGNAASARFTVTLRR